MNDRPTFPEPQLVLRGVGDIVAEIDAWGANCGPAAIAAALGKLLPEVREAVSPGGTFRGYMGVADFKAAIPRAGGRIVRQWSKPMGPTDCFAFGNALSRLLSDSVPVIVLARFCGPWDGVPRAPATFRHAFAFRRCVVGEPTYWLQHLAEPGWVYDANNPADAWMPHRAWCNQTLIHLLPERGDGGVAIDWMAQVAA